MGGKNYPIKIPQHGVPEAQRDNAPDPRQSTPGHSGGSLRVFTVPARPGVPGQGGKAVSPRPERGAGRQFAWLEAGSGNRRVTLQTPEQSNRGSLLKIMMLRKTTT